MYVYMYIYIYYGIEKWTYIHAPETRRAPSPKFGALGFGLWARVQGFRV